MREYMACVDVWWHCVVVVEQRTSTGNAALFVQMPEGEV